MKKILLAIIKFYQKLISPFLGKNCRFLPTCSAYCYEAIEKFGIFKGMILTIIRLSKCHPFSKEHGYDPVPDKFEFRKKHGQKT